MPPKNISKAELSVDLFVEVLEAAIHVLICNRGVYPKQVFERRMLYGTPVYIARHPGLCQYIASVLLNMKSLLVDDLVDKIVVAIYADEDDRVLETYNFEVFDIGKNDGDETERGGNQLAELELQLRDLLLR
jgi:mitotic spindle assembly checkpoint protein MAD2B